MQCKSFGHPITFRVFNTQTWTILAKAGIGRSFLLLLLFFSFQKGVETGLNPMRRGKTRPNFKNIKTNKISTIHALWGKKNIIAKGLCLCSHELILKQIASIVKKFFFILFFIFFKKKHNNKTLSNYLNHIFWPSIIISSKILSSLSLPFPLSISALPSLLLLGLLDLQDLLDNLLLFNQEGSNYPKNTQKESSENIKILVLLVETLQIGLLIQK